MNELIGLLGAVRQGRGLTPDQVNLLVRAGLDGSMTDAQLGAFTMAVCFQGLEAEAQLALTLAMRDSGRVLDWRDLDGPAVDKHSTGGVGDTTTLVLAPLVAACGGIVPKMTGRELGHTGGTLDKLESIPGFKSQLSIR